jgi:hypothetical protein
MKGLEYFIHNLLFHRLTLASGGRLRGYICTFTFSRWQEPRDIAGLPSICRLQRTEFEIAGFSP